MNTGQSVGVVSSIVNIFKTEGVFGLYKGWLTTLAGLAPYVAFKMACFDLFKPLVIPDASSAYFSIANMCLGAVSGTFGVTITYPTDLLRRRMQLRDATTPYNSILQLMRHIY